MHLMLILLIAVPCSLFPVAPQPATAAPVHPDVLAERHARGEKCDDGCPSGVGNVWKRVAARSAARPQSASLTLAPNITFLDTDNIPDTISVGVFLCQFQVDALTTTTDSGQFPDFGSVDAADTATIAGRAQTMMDRLDTFYKAMSYGKVRIKSKVFGDTLLVTVVNNMTTYMNDASSPTGLDNLFREVFGRTDSSVNFTHYDVVVVFHAGMAQQLGSSSKLNIPALFQTLATTDSYSGGGAGETVTMGILMALDGAQPGQGDFSGSETVTMFGTLAHEFGHALGLPDLYNTSTGVKTRGIGKWGLMGTGNYLGFPQGDSPSWMEAWSREYLNWCETVVLDSTATVTSFDTTLQRAEVDSRLYKIYPKTATKTEYFLLEVREPTVTDLDTVPGTGLLIWHIDNTVGTIGANNVNATDNNSAASHGRVHLESADADRATTISGLGDAGDPYPGSSSVTGIGDNTTPNSRGYGDTVARFALKNIVQGSSVSFKIDLADVNIAVSAVKYPSTCIVGRVLAPWPAAVSFGRAVRDAFLSCRAGRVILSRVAE